MKPARESQTRAEREQERFDKLSIAARRTVSSAIARKQKLIANLRGDLQKHGNPEQWKRFGDLILANLNNAVRNGDEIVVVDHFDEHASTLSIAGERNLSLTDVANGYFRRYTRSRNARGVIDERMAAAEREIAESLERLQQVEAAIEAGDIEFLFFVVEPRHKATEVRPKKKKDVDFKGARRFVSSDGFEILVGKRAQDNDTLTFRVARSLDTWMHAADYPGSHVVIRNPNRKEVPQRTLGEAARLAAFYSGARELGKAAVNYTQKKFVNKPKRAAPGLVSLASFKTLIVKPEVPSGLSAE